MRAYPVAKITAVLSSLSRCQQPHEQWKPPVKFAIVLPSKSYDRGVKKAATPSIVRFRHIALDGMFLAQTYLYQIQLVL